VISKLHIIIQFDLTENTTCLHYKNITVMLFREISFIARILRNIKYTVMEKCRL